MKEKLKLPAVFLDRDGTLIRDVKYLRRADQLEILLRVPESIRLLRDHGFRVVVVTNQSVVARGGLTEEELGKIHIELNRRLAMDGAQWDGIYYCPHHPTEGIGLYNVVCDCRKPNTGMIRRAAEDLGIEPRMSYVVGDQESDMELAARVGARGVRISSQRIHSAAAAVSYSAIMPDLWQAAQWIVSAMNPRGREG
jgi:D-glycero-D-manno-heptose 1,7-bisphosphate phosphatase